MLLLFVSTGSTETNLPRGGGWCEFDTIIPDSGRIAIDDPWLLAGNVSILLEGDTLLSGVDYLWIDSLSTIEFLPSDCTISGMRAKIKYQSATVLDTLVFRKYYPFIPKTAEDTPGSRVREIRERALNPLSAWKGMRRSGSITRGVRIDPGGTGSVTSGLHLELSGRPAAGVKIDAILDDRNMPASSSGASATLAELDRMLLQVTTPHISARLGDWDLSWDAGRYGTFARRLKGGYLSVQYPILKTDIAAAGGNTTFRSTDFMGRDGDQGPYELTDRAGRTGIIVAAGSEKLYLDGNQLTRGRRADYLIDYSRGTIIFNPTHPIRSDSRIEVEYEYNDAGYPRFFYSAKAGSPAEQSEGLRFETFAAVEGRDEENPLTFDWTDSWRDIAGDAGDDPLNAMTSGIDSVGENQGDYIWHAAGDSVVVFSDPDSITGHPTGYLQVTFSRYLGGGYEKTYDDSLLAFYYQWVGNGNGDWAPVRYIPLPDKTSLAGVHSTFNTKTVRLEAEVAFSDFDANTLSSLDDNDNSGSAWNWQGLWTPEVERPLTVSALMRHEDHRFQPLSRTSDIDHRFRWDISDDTTGSETEIGAGLNFNPLQDVELSADGGYLERGSLFKGRRGSIDGSSRISQLSLSGGLNRVEGEYPTDGWKSQRTNLFGTVVRERGKLQPSYSVRSEVRKVSGSNTQKGNRYLEQEAGLGIILSEMQDVNLKFAYRADDELVSDDVDHISDTRTANVTWQGRNPDWGGWSVEMLRYYQTYTDPLFDPVVSTSAAFETSVRPSGSPWSVMIDYGLITGSDRASAQIASFVGEGQGSYRREEGGRYVLDPDGNIDLYEIDTDLLRQTSRVNFIGQMTWNPGKLRRHGEHRETYPLGITRLTSRFEAELNTSSNDPWRAFLLFPEEFNRLEVINSRRTWLEELFFLEGNPTGDGKLAYRREIDRDRAFVGGEITTFDRVTLRFRLRPFPLIRFETTPAWQRNLRKNFSLGGIESDVTGIGGDTEVTLRPLVSRLEYGLRYGFERRKDRVSDNSVTEQRIIPRLTWRVGTNGTARFEGGWRGLTSGGSNPGYDLTDGWEIGNNWSLDIGFDYNLGSNVVATAYFRGSWDGDERPRNSGLIEFTARL
ncbi:hypothetical protein HQ587_01250 [bacterium]|nr:hypothetical protein [bacterium]